MDTKFIEVSPIGWIQLSAAVIRRVSIVIRHPFATQIIVGAQHPTQYFLWTVLITAVAIRQALITGSKMTEKTHLPLTPM